MLFIKLLIIYKPFIRSHLDHRDVIHDQPNSESLSEKSRKKQFCEALALTGAIKCTSHLKVWQLFKPWSCIRPLCTFSLEIKSTSHFFLQCHFYNGSRLSIFTDLRKVEENFKKRSNEILVFILCYIAGATPPYSLIKGRVEFL